MTREHIQPNADGEVRLPEAPGLGLEPDLAALGPFVRDVEIRVGGKLLYRTPELS
jgi:hypothetical protein